MHPVSIVIGIVIGVVGHVGIKALWDKVISDLGKRGDIP